MAEIETENPVANALEAVASGLRALGKENAIGPGAVEALGMSIAGTPPGGGNSLTDGLLAIAESIERVAVAIDGHAGVMLASMSQAPDRRTT